MSLRSLAGGLVLLLTALTTFASAQVSTLIAPNEASRFGLERMWFTRIQFDRARGRITHIQHHVSSTNGYTVYEVLSERGRTVITDPDVDRFGDVLGRERAEKEANNLVTQLERADLKPELKTQVFPVTSLVVVSDTGTVQYIDAETGRTRWSVSVGNPRYLTTAPGINDHYVAVANGSSIYVLDHATGNIVWRRQAVGVPGAGPALSERKVFVPMSGGTIEAYELENYRNTPWIFKGHGRAMIQPVIVSTTVAWPTDRGHLYVAEANLAGIQYRLETDRSIAAPATPLPPNRIVCTGTDGYVYCIQEASGRLVWRFSTGEPILSSALGVEEAVYVVTDDDNLFRLNATTGLQDWSISGMRQVVSASKDRLYCLGDTGRLTILDANTGSLIGTLATESLDVHMINHQTDRIILGSSTGLIQCLRETQNEWPIIRAGGLEEKTEEQAERPEAGAGETMPPAEGTQPPTTETPPATDPFGTETTAPPANPTDPFADPFKSP